MRTAAVARTAQHEGYDTMNRIRRAALAAALGLAGLLTACGGGSSGGSSDTAHVRMLNASSGYPALNLYVAGTKTATAVGYGQASDYADVASGSVTTSLTNSTSTAALTTATRTASGGNHYAVVAYGSSGGLKSIFLAEETAAAAANQTTLGIFNLAPDAGSVDVYLTGTTDALADATAVIAGLAGGSSTTALTVTSGTYRLTVTGANDKNDIRLQADGITLGSTQVANLLLTPTAGAMLVQALLVPQQGTPSQQLNASARVRVVASVAANGTVNASVGGTAVLAAPSPQVGAYTLVAANSGSTTPVTLKVNGATVTVPPLTLSAGGDYSLLVWGDAAAPQTALIADDNKLPTVATNARLRLVHAVNGLTAPLSLTADLGSVADSIAQGSASAYGTVTGNSSMQLSVTSPLSATPLYSSTTAPILANHVYTVWALGDSTAPAIGPRRDR